MKTIRTTAMTLKQISMKTAVAVIGLGMAAATVPGNGFASGSEREESYEHHDSRGGESKIYGTVKKMPSDRIGTWTVDGREIKVTNETRIKEEYGKAVIGAYVEIEGTKTDKGFTAHKIEVKRPRK